MADLSNRKTARKPSLSTAAPTSSATLFLSKAQPEDDFGLIRKRLGTQLYPVMHPWPFSLEVGFATLRGRPLRGPASLFCAFIPTSSFFFFSFACFLRRRVPCGLSLSPRQSHEPSAASGATRLAEPSSFLTRSRGARTFSIEIWPASRRDEGRKNWVDSAP